MYFMFIVFRFTMRQGKTISSGLCLCCAIYYLLADVFVCTCGFRGKSVFFIVSFRMQTGACENDLGFL